MRVGCLFEKMPFHIKETVFCSYLLKVKVINGCWICQIPFFGLKMIMWVSLFFLFSSVQSFSRVWLFATPWISACQTSLSITNSQSSPKFMPMESVMPSSHLTLCCPLLLLPPIPPSIRVFSKSQLFAWGGQSTGVSASASFPLKKSQGWSPSEWTGWISLQSKGLSSLLQHHSSKASILGHSAFFTVQLSHPYMTTGTTVALTRDLC